MNELIFETIYHAAMETSMELAKVDGHYETFPGSPLSQGKFQFDLWNVKPCSTRYDWEGLRKDVIKYGARNSLLLAPMPTASTSQILGLNESFEPYTSNVYTRRVLAGEFVCMNPHLVNDLIELGLWNSAVKNALLAFNGSVQQVNSIPQNIKDLYKTVWEIPQRSLLDAAIARGPYICQSQSMNIYMAEATFAKMTSMHFYGWKKGLKTGQYYLRTRPSRDAIKFTVDIEQLLSATDAGDNDEILKCLTLAKQASKITLDVIKAGAEEEKRDERFNSTVGTEEEQALAKKLKENPMGTIPDITSSPKARVVACSGLTV